MSHRSTDVQTLTTAPATSARTTSRSDHLADSLQDSLADPLQSQGAPVQASPENTAVGFPYADKTETGSGSKGAKPVEGGFPYPDRTEAKNQGGRSNKGSPSTRNSGKKRKETATVDIDLGKYKRTKIPFLVAVSLVENWTKAERAACDKLLEINRGTWVGPTDRGPGWAPPKAEQWVKPLSSAGAARGAYTKARDPKKAKVWLEKAVAHYNVVHSAWQNYQVTMGVLAEAQKTTAEVSVWLASTALSGGLSGAVSSAGGGVLARAGASAGAKVLESGARRYGMSRHEELNEPFSWAELAGDGLAEFLASITGGVFKATLDKHLIGAIGALSALGVPHAAKAKILAKAMAELGQATVKAAVERSKRVIAGKPMTKKQFIEHVAEKSLKDKLKPLVEEIIKKRLAK